MFEKLHLRALFYNFSKSISCTFNSGSERMGLAILFYPYVDIFTGFHLINEPSTLWTCYFEIHTAIAIVVQISFKGHWFIFINTDCEIHLR